MHVITELAKKQKNESVQEISVCIDLVQIMIIGKENSPIGEPLRAKKEA